MKYRLTALMLVLLMIIQVPGITAFATTSENTPENSVLTDKINLSEMSTPNINATEDNKTENTNVVSEQDNKSDCSSCVFNFSAAKYVMSESGESYTITAYAVPKTEFITIRSDGSSEITDMKNIIPDSMIKSKEISVTVSNGSSGSGSSGAEASYDITFETNGGSKLDSIKVNKNSILSEPKAPVKDGYIFDGWCIDKELTMAYDFTANVTKNITLYAKWTEKTSEPDKPVSPDVQKWENPFTDVNIGDWFYKSVEYTVKYGLFNGTGKTTFEPDGLLTRAMLVTALWRADGKPLTDYTIPFDDVDTNGYYTEAVCWAASNNIVNGVSKNEFAPDDYITREQIAAIIYRYAQHKGYDASMRDDTNILSYTDAESISEYAIPSVQYAVGAGLIKGKSETTLNPKDNATRAEIAAILHRFFEAK